MSATRNQKKEESLAMDNKPIPVYRPVSVLGLWLHGINGVFALKPARRSGISFRMNEVRAQSKHQRHRKLTRSAGTGCSVSTPPSSRNGTKNDKRKTNASAKLS